MPGSSRDVIPRMTWASPASGQEADSGYRHKCPLQADVFLHVGLQTGLTAVEVTEFQGERTP
jgi:hypothetical protein